MYKVLYGFIDSVENRNYKEGDEFIVGVKTDKARLRVLMGYDNNLHRPLILEVEQPKQHEPKALDEFTVAELKEMAQERGLDFKVKSTKSELIAMLQGE